MPRTTKQLTIVGRVQGVGFRYSMCDEAARRGLAGWVKNLADGSVQAVVQGEPKEVGAIIEWVKKSPGASQVERVEEVDSAGEFGEFEIRY